MAASSPILSFWRWVWLSPVPSRSMKLTVLRFPQGVFQDRQGALPITQLNPKPGAPTYSELSAAGQRLGGCPVSIFPVFSGLCARLSPPLSGQLRDPAPSEKVLSGQVYSQLLLGPHAYWVFVVLTTAYRIVRTRPYKNTAYFFRLLVFCCPDSIKGAFGPREAPSKHLSGQQALATGFSPCAVKLKVVRTGRCAAS